jgi:hypothetical protein
MPLERNLNSPLRALYVLIGVLMIAYAVFAHLLIAGLTVLLLIVVGALFIAAGLRGT